MTNVLLISNIAPLYRKPLWEELSQLDGVNLTFLTSTNKLLGIESIDLSQNKIVKFKPIKNIIIRGVIFWQKKVIKNVIFSNYDHYIFLGEANILSSWIAILILKFRKKKVYLWGHGLYGNEGILKLFLRKSFYRLADKHLLYERRAKQIMISNGFAPDKLYVIFNSLNYERHKLLRKKFETISKEDTFPFFARPNLPVLIFTGRLTPVKKIDLLLNAVNIINKENPVVNLIIIGDGPTRDLLENVGKRGVEKKWLYFTGSCYDEEVIGQYLFAADICVSPGNVGLTAIHSLSYGTPVCSHNNYSNQMPEIESIEEDVSGFFFKENDLEDLVSKLLNWFKKDLNREEIRQMCYVIIDKYYNPHYQVSVFKKLLDNIPPEL